MTSRASRFLAVLWLVAQAGHDLLAQSAPAIPINATASAGDVATDVSADRRVTFRISAPRAAEVLVRGDWGLTRRFETAALTKDSSGVWAVTIGPVPPPIVVMRYAFSVDGVPVVDPRARGALTTGDGVQSLVVLPNSDDPSVERRVPHGSVRTVTYWSGVLGITRRMRIYTPPGYDLTRQPFPVVYLFPGAGGDDVLWSELGRAGLIVDNLIADQKARPMVLVMPDPRVPGQPVDILPTEPSQDRFTADFLQEIVPYVGRNLRVRTDAASTAIAGASTGGAKSLLLTLNHLDQFAYVGLFSSGWFPKDLAVVEAKHQSLLDAPRTKQRLKLLWVGVGTADLSAAFPNAPFLLKMFDRHGLKYTYRETDGDHTWINWRRYFADFATRLFH